MKNKKKKHKTHQTHRYLVAHLHRSPSPRSSGIEAMHRGHLGRDAVDGEDDVDEGQRQHHQEEWGDLPWIFPIEKQSRDFPHGDLTCGFVPIENVRCFFRKIPIRMVEKKTSVFV